LRVFNLRPKLSALMNRRSAAREFGEVLAQLIVVVIMEAFDGRILDGAVPLPGNGLPANRERDALDLAIRPGVPDLGQPVLDLMLAADPVEDVLEGINVPVVMGELDAIIRCPATVCLQTVRGGEHDVEPVGHGGDQVAQEGCGGQFPGLSVQFNESELGGAVPSRAFSMPCQATDGDEEIQLAFSRLNLSNINVEVAEWVGLELLLRRLVIANLREA